MVRDGIYYALALFAVGALLYLFSHMLVFPVMCLLLAAFFLWFFRDPQRKVPTAGGLVVSPADGKVTAVEQIETALGPRTRLSIFLSVFNVHVNRVPVAGTVTEVVYTKGLYLNALNANSAVQNERNLVAIQSPEGVIVTFTQIAGLLARRIVCRLKAGDTIRRGERMGMIKFGSRVDVVLPPDAQVRVKLGDTVHGGSSVLASLAGTGPA